MSYTNINQVLEILLNTCLSYLHDKITEGFDFDLLTGMVLIDLQKTFDTIDHNILIKKCLFWILLMRQSSGTYHISQTAIFVISMENANSDKTSITCGVPQGSIFWSSALFNLYQRHAATCR